MNQTVLAARSIGRPRSLECRVAVLKATNDIMEEVGFSQLSIEAIAARAGCAKTTIYRWWNSKGVLAIEAFLTNLAPKIAFPDSSSAIAAIKSQMQTLAAIYQGNTGRIIAELIALGQEDPETRENFLHGYVEPRRTAAKLVLQRGIDQGEINPAVDLDFLVDALYGPIFHRMLVRHAALTPAYAKGIAELVLQGTAVPDKNQSLHFKPKIKTIRK